MKEKVNDMKGVTFEGGPLSSSPIYKMWINMHSRSHGQYHYSQWERYRDVSVCDEWYTLSSFYQWVSDRDWRGKELDKDLLDPNNTIYSPSTCLLVPKIVNYLLLDSKKIRGDLPIGVHRSSRKNYPYKAECKIGNGKSKFLGRYKTKEEAHAAWQVFKMDRIISIADSLFSADEICDLTYNVMLDRAKVIQYHIDHGNETKSIHHFIPPE